MAKDLGDLIVRLSLDASKFDDGMKRLESQMVKVQEQFKSSSTGVTNFDKVLEKLRTSSGTLTERLGLQKDKVAQLERAYAESARTKGTDAEETQRLAKKLDEAKAAVDRTEKALGQVNQQIKLNESGWYQFGVNLEGVGTKLQAVGKNMTDIGTKMSVGVTAPIVALGTYALKAGIEFESAFAGVRKTVNATEEEFTFLSDSIKEMSERIPATTTELSGIMEMAGQLGVRGSDNLLKFTEVIAALGVSTNLTNEAAADMLAKFANVAGMDLQNIDRLGSVIVALGNNFATTEADIVKMGMGLAGAGAQLGMSEAQIMAFATALSSVGIQAEAGGTAFTKLMINMKVAAETGQKGKEVIDRTGKSLRDLQMLADQDSAAFKKLANKLGLTSEELKGFMVAASDLDQFAKVTGMTAEQFAKAYGEDAAGALMKFISGLKEIDENGGSAILTLDEMGITETRLRDAILRACEAEGLFTEAQEVANAAWSENTALQNEANQRYATTESRIKMAKNAANNLAIEFSGVMLPTLEKLLEKLRGVIDWLKGLNDKQMETIVKIAAVAAAIGPVLVVIGQMTTGIGGLMKILAPLAKAIGGAQASTGLLGTALSALTGPVGIVLAAIAALVAAFIGLYNTNDEFRAKVDAVWAQVCAAFENAKAVFQATFAQMKEAFAPVMESLAALWEKIQTVFGELAPLLEPIFTAVGGIIGGFVATVVAAANGILTALAPLVEAIIAAVDVVVSIFGALVALMHGDVSGAWVYVQNAIMAFDTVVTQVLTAVGAFFQGFWTSLCAIAQGFGLNLQTFFSSLWTNIQAGVTTAWTAVSTWLSTTWNTIATTATTAWNTVCTNVQTAITTAKAGIESAWTAITTAISSAWTTFQATATTAWNTVCTNVQTAISSAKAGIESAWTAITTAINSAWATFQGTATTAWNTVCTNVKNAVTSAKSGIESAWTTITTAIKTGWTTFSTTATTSWNTITNAVKTAVSSAQTGIVQAWESIKTAIKTAWDAVTGIFKSPIESAITWLTEKVNWMKGLFNFQWKLPEFKLPTISVTWNEIGWGIKIPKLSLNWNALGGIFDKPTIFATAGAGLQGVGEAGPEAILPLKTLWAEMSVRLKTGMREILRDAGGERSRREETLLRALIDELRRARKDPPRPGAPVQVTQNIYADQTSYAGQQREAARQFRQIAREMQ